MVRGLGAVTVIAFLLVSLTPASNIAGHRLAVTSEPPQQADAIVVLGSGLMPGGVLNEESMRRVIKGIELFKKGMAPLLVVSGTGRFESPAPSEAAVRAKLAEEMGIPPAAILKEETANTTHEESIHISSTLRGRNAARILLVTESLHMRRASQVFERAGLQVQPAASADYPAIVRSPGDRLWLAMRIAQESIALIYYRLAGYI
jgi:uncharacterized SAM-binding protein YcdF (DUF218 family)